MRVDPRAHTNPTTDGGGSRLLPAVGKGGAERARSNPRELWTAAFLVAAVLVSYFPAIQGRLLWDDAGHVTRPDLRSPHGLWRIWFELGATQQYYPLLHSAFWIEHRLWGDATAGYHLINILFHASTACLLLLILRRLSLPGASLAAAIFALHPVHVESVAWITEQKNTLSALFYAGAALAYLRFDRERRSSLYALALGLFVMGLLTKTVVATLPAALLVIFWWQRGRITWRRDVVPLVPWFALGGAAGLFTAWVERKLIGAEGAAFDLSVLQRCLLAGRAFWFYLGKLFLPLDLMFIYPRWRIDPAAWWQYLFPIGALALLCALWRLRARRRGPLAGMLFFVGSLFPVLGFFNVYPFVYSFVADHFQYLASVGIIVVMSAGAGVALAALPQRARWAGRGLCVMLLTTLAALTWQQSRGYVDSLTLYRATLEKNPDCWMCRNNLAFILTEAGRLQEAIEQCEQALRTKPDSAEVQNTLGSALFQKKAVWDAIGHYEEAVRLRPSYFEARTNLGIAFAALGRAPEARQQFEIALRIRPDYPPARDGLAALEAQQQQQSESGK